MKRIGRDILVFMSGCILTASTIGVIAYTYQADDIEYTTNKNSQVHNVEQAINDLYKRTECSYKVNDVVFSNTYTINAPYTFEVPCNGRYKIELWGASGKTVNYTAAPGKGAYTSGDIELIKNTKLYVFIGEAGNVDSTNYNVLSFNGGGYTHGTSAAYGRGGGATDVRIYKSSTNDWNDFESLKSRIMVAGGGGSGHSGSTDVGGDAGGLTSYAGGGSGSGAAPATQISGYQFGIGGPGLPYEAYSGSGGGYFGGKSSTASPCTLSYGGSSYISGHVGSNSIAESSTSSSLSFTNSEIHYSKMKFTNTVMIDGKGYKWTTTADTSKVVGMPTTNGTSSENGHLGNGYAKITYLGQ